MGKSFINFLKEQEKEEMIYVGTKDGAGWLFIETAETLINRIDEFEACLHKRVTGIYDRSIRTVHNLPSLMVNDQKKIEQLKTELNMLKYNPKSADQSKSIKDTEKALRRSMNMLSDKERKFVSAYRTRKKYDKALKQWTRLEFREVVESYNHTSDRVGVCVLLT